MKMGWTIKENKMSNSKVMNQKGVEMDKSFIELQTVICQSCGAENTLSDSLNASAFEAITKNAKMAANNEYEELLKIERDRLQQEAKIDAEKFSQNKLKSLSEELTEISAKKTKLEIENAKFTAIQASMQQKIELESELAATKAVNKARAEFALGEQEQKEEINRLKSSIAKLKDTSNAGSSQLTGETGELLIEDRLRELFPRDLIEEIKKGQNGADCLWNIRTNGGRLVSKIYFESKVTQSFQSAWTQKLKSDMVEKGASIGIIVTKSMPNNQETCGLRDGVWICGFHEFETLAKAMRQAQIDLSRTLTQEAIKESKSNDLFDFVVGHEFSGIMEKILRPIFEQQELLEKEKRSMTRIWKTREKHIDNSVNGASLLAGQLEVILGASVVNQIGFEKFDVLEIIEDKEANNA